MTNKEITEMIKKYESKWGRLGHTNIMRPELNHSGEEGGTTMSSMTNDLIAFRQKVAAGREANRLAHKSTVNVTDINRRYFEEITTNGTLIHAGTNQQNYKYYQKIDLGNGQSRYFYTKEEWDAYQNEKNGKKQSTGGAEKVRQMHNEKESNLQGMIKDGDYYEKGEDGKFHKTDKKWEDVRKQAIEEADNKIIDAAKEGGYEAAKKAIFDDDRMLEMFGQFEGGFENHGWELNDDNSITGMNDDDEKYFKEMETWLRSFKDSTGIDIYKNPDFQKSVMDEIRKRYNLMKNQAKEKEDIKNGNKKYAASEGTGKKSEEKKEETTKTEEKKTESNSGSDFDKKLNETITNEGSDATADYIINNSPEFKAYANALRKAVADGKIKVYRDGGMTGKENKELASTFDPLLEDLDALLQKAAKNPDFDRKGVEKLINKEFENIAAAATEDKYGVRDNTKKFVKHSSEEPEIMDEYSAFMERVKKGREKNKLAHSIMISPSDLNARYEQSIKDHCFLIHSGNFKYYNKIDLGNGQSRYFYTKAEWDAYQDGLGQQKKADAPKKAIAEQKNNMSGYADWKKQQNEDATKKQQKETIAKNKAADEAKARANQANSTIIKKQQAENFKKNEAAAKAEGERMAQKYSVMSSTDSSTNKKPSEVTQENPMEEARKKLAEMKGDKTEYVQKNAERINNEYNKAAEDEHNISLQIDEKYGFNKAKTDEEVNKCWDNLVQDMYQTALTIDNPDKCYMNFFWHDENGNGSAGWDIYIPEFEQWANEYQKEIDKVFEQAQNAGSYDESKKYGDLWEAMNEELRFRSLEAKTKTLKMVTNLKKKCLEQK